MTHYIVIPANRETALRNAYKNQGIRGQDNPNEDEEIGVMIAEGPGGQDRLITGTYRAALADIDALRLGNSPWLEIVEEWPADWVYPTEASG